jgi:predicted transcriptional regulator
MKGGGYYHAYGAIDVKSFKIITERKEKEIQQSFDRLLKRFEHDIDHQLMSFYKKQK